MLTRFLLNAAVRLTHSRPADFVIGDPDNPYLLRWWWLPRNKIFNIYVHVFLRDDDDRALHDHPWASLSLLCRGTLLEVYQDPNRLYESTKHITVGNWTYRSAKFAHRLVVPKQAYSPVTIFITGPRIREWGFHCKNGWKHWKDFCGIGNKGTIGAGCGEGDL